MDNPSPGPGWWLASDDKWYPQQWEYTWVYASGKNALNDLMHKADELGIKGWEMVSHWYLDQGQQVRCNAYFKRPIKPS
jgi:hypothetical protein